METLWAQIQTVLWNVFNRPTIADVLDILIVAFLLYELLMLTKETRASAVLKGLVTLVVASWVSDLLGLTALNWVLLNVVNNGAVVLVILFQPELRSILEQVGSSKLNFLGFFSKEREASVMESAIRQTVVACTEMSKSRTGVLIVFERELLLDDMVRSGTVLDAAVSSELLKNIFFIKAPMHDGAVIVRQGRILGAGCMLPLSKNVNLSRDLGMRHRAGIGMSENSDAVVVIVSEETGSISVAIGGMLKRHLMPETLENILRNELIPQEETEEKKRKFNLMEFFRARKSEDNNEKD